MIDQLQIKLQQKQYSSDDKKSKNVRVLKTSKTSSWGFRT